MIKICAVFIVANVFACFNTIGSTPNYYMKLSGNKTEDLALVEFNQISQKGLVNNNPLNEEMAKLEFEKTYDINGSADQLIAILKDLEHYGRLHPLIRSVKPVDQDSSHLDKFKIKERPFKKLPVTIKYFASVESSDSEVNYQLSGIPFTKGHIQYSIIPISSKETQLKFFLQIDNKVFGKKILLKKMIAAQNELIDNLNSELQSLNSN